MAQMFSDVPEGERYSDKEFDEIVGVLARILHGNNKHAKICEVAGTYDGSLEFVKQFNAHKELIKSLSKGKYPLPQKEIGSCREYKAYLKDAAALQNELKDLECARIVVKSELNPAVVEKFDYVEKIDPGKFEGSIRQKRVNLAREAYELQKRNQISWERGNRRYG